ncbi:MAG: hypothetical protein SFW09_05640 [Hyphomicrobiaceae bacterium]|nr:hypothetical protein [Hyphomicrobiaceae bacterium]
MRARSCTLILSAPILASTWVMAVADIDDSDYSVALDSALVEIAMRKCEVSMTSKGRELVQVFSVNESATRGGKPNSAHVEGIRAGLRMRRELAISSNGDPNVMCMTLRRMYGKNGTVREDVLHFYSTNGLYKQD